MKNVVGLRAPRRVVFLRGLLGIMVVLMAASPVAAQEAPPPPPESPSSGNSAEQAAKEAFRDYVIGPQDLLSIQILESPELSREVRVGPDGTVGLPLLDRVSLQGLTLSEAEELLEKKYVESGILNTPHITITVQDLQSKPVTVMGAVRNPGVIQVSGQSRLLRVLSQAGGTTPEAGGYIRVIRADTRNEEQVLQIRIEEALQGSLEANIPIYGGDTVNVVPAGAVFVVGAVNQPGRHLLTGEGDETSILQVLAMAHDLKSTAKSDKSVLIRKNEKGEMQQIPVDIRRILKQEVPDVTVLANDVLYVPDSAAKRAFTKGLQAALQVATGIAILGVR